MNHQSPIPAQGTEREQLYRRVIDQLVTETLTGQGQIDARQVQEGDWRLGEEQERVSVNHLLARLNGSERELLGSLLNQAFTAGVHECLVALYDHEIAPFDEGYEGTPYQDYMGRLDGWTWPPETASS